MKLINPIGRNVQKVESGAAYDITPYGCTCNTVSNDMTKQRKHAGGCSHCAASCRGDKNLLANSHVANAKNKY